MHYTKLFTLISIMGLVGCTTTGSVTIDQNQPAAYQETLPDGKGWWYARFRMDWQEEEKPNWYLGALVGAEVIAPVIKKHRQDIKLWRFHRRAKRDGHDHVFSFIFYSSAQTARHIYNEIDDNALLTELQTEALITWVGFDDTSAISKPDINDTSEVQWPEIVQKTWPVYIMGASQMWLDLVTEFAKQQDSDFSKIELYKEVQNQITEIWQEQGGHAWLHHLNALYAYQPLLMRY